MKDLLFRILGYGVGDRTGEDRRRVIAVNLILAMNVLTALGYIALCALYDAWGLRAQIATYVVGIPIWSLSYLILPRNPVLAGLWWICAVSAILIILAWLTGRDSGFHLYLLAGPGILLTLVGAERWRTAAALSGMQLLAVLFVQFTFTAPAPFMRVDETLAKIFMTLALSGTFVFGFIPVFDALIRVRRAEDALAVEYARSEGLLENMLPAAISARLKDAGDQPIADDVAEMSVLFADIVDFTPRAATRPAAEVVEMLNRVFSAFDRLTETQGLEKIKTIGDAYMVVSGAPDPRPDHAAAMAEMALGMMAEAERLGRTLGEAIQLRIGLHTGPAVAGVIGARKFSYDVWGDTVNTAARMESQGETGRIQISREMKTALGDAYVCAPRGVTEIKGKGPTETWWLTGRASV